MSPKSALCAACLALLGTSLAHAGNEDRTILLLVKNMPGAPTPAEIVDYTNTWPHAASPPLQAFTVKDPMASGYLMEDHAAAISSSGCRPIPTRRAGNSKTTC